MSPNVTTPLLQLKINMRVDSVMNIINIRHFGDACDLITYNLVTKILFMSQS